MIYLATEYGNLRGCLIAVRPANATKDPMRSSLYPIGIPDTIYGTTRAHDLAHLMKAGQTGERVAGHLPDRMKDRMAAPHITPLKP
jgi:hypothetical protein